MSLLVSARASLASALDRLRRSESLRAKAARGTIWLGAGSGAEQALRFVRQIILARFLLPPEAFGAMAIVQAVSGLFEAFTEVGIKQSVIQHPRGDAPAYWNGAWWFAFARGVILFAVGYAVMPWIADVYNEPDLPDLLPMLRVAFLSLVFSGAMSTRAYAAQKAMDYRRWVAVDSGGAVLGILTAIGLGFVVGDAWALVIGFVVEAAGRCLLSFVLCPFRPGFKFEKALLRDLFIYAAGMIGLPVLTFLYNKTDVFVVGKLCTTQDLGFYSVAFSLAQTPNVLYGAILVPILMPAFASMQHDNKVLTANLIRSTQYVALLTLPGFTFLACAASQVLTLLYGSRYAVVSGTFAILSATVAVRVIGRGLVTIYFATGRPHLSRQALMIRLGLMVTTIYPLTHRFGLAGAAWAGLLAATAGEAFNLYKLHRVIGLSISRFLGGLAGGAALSAVVIALWQIFRLI